MSNIKTSQVKQSLKNNIGTQEILRGLFAGVGAVILTVLVTLFRTQLSQYQEYGYPGILFACFIANSTVFLPAPSSAIVMNFGAVYSPLWVAVVGGIGAALGDCIGYVAGVAGKALVSRNKSIQFLDAWLNNMGWLTVFIFAFLPLPLFDILGVLAGASGMRWRKFAPPLFLGKILKMILYAYAGAGLVPLLEPYIHKIINNTQ